MSELEQKYKVWHQALEGLNRDTIQPETWSAYSSYFRQWRLFLGESRIHNQNGLLGSRRGAYVGEDEAMFALSCFIGWMKTNDTSPSQYKKYFAAIVKHHDTRQHYIPTSITAKLYKLIRRVATSVKKRPKAWLQTTELERLDRAIFELPKTRSGVAIEAVYNLWRELFFRPASILQKTLQDAPRFKFEDTIWGNQEGRLCVRLHNIRERCSAKESWQGQFGSGVLATLKTKQEQIADQRLGVAQALLSYAGKAKQNEKGPIKRAHNSPMLTRWLSDQLAVISLRSIGKKVTPSMLRRSNFLQKSYSHTPRELANLARHVSVNTQKQFYLPLDKRLDGPPASHLPADQVARDC